MKNYCAVIAMNTFWKPKRSLILVMTAVFFTAGCESVPDLPGAMNPMSWFTDDEKPVAANQADAAKAYPDLKSVPERPKRPSLADQQSRIKQGLAADTKNARYTDVLIRKEVQKRVAGRAAPSQATLAQLPILAPPSVASSVKAVVVAPPTKRILAPVIRRPAVVAVSPAPVMKIPQPHPAPQVAKGLFKIGTIYFKDGSAVVQRSDVPILQQLAGAQRQSGGILEIVGHASGLVKTFDPVRRSSINYEVSLRRAKSVGTALVGLGVPVSQLRMDGVGDSKQLYSEYTPAGEAANRRVEIFLRR